MSYKKKEFQINNCSEKYEFGKVAKQADGSVLLTEGDTVVLAAVAVDSEPVEEDFLPLTVQYLEKSYAIGIIPGGFIKREKIPGDFETLTARIIDRSLRPLFPKGFNYPVVITVTVLSCAEGADLQRIGLNAASAALFVSSLPVDICVTGVRIGKIDNELRLNPSIGDLKNSALDLFVAGTGSQVLMIEMKANGTTKTEIMESFMIDPILEPMSGIEPITTYNTNEMNENELMEALKIASVAIDEATTAYKNSFEDSVKEKKEYELKTEELNENVYKFIKENFSQKIKNATNQLAKSERSDALKDILKEILNTNEALQQEWQKNMVEPALNKIKKEIVRAQILNEKIRADGRALNQVRPIAIETNILPRAHSSVLFTRGQTQALAVLTLGSDQDRQSYETLTISGTQHESLMINYNF
ncbi:MAG: polyribonucleotide nucleotidyltransferase, partial [Campylobacterota bacterium]|nr:polyribonucleotide nucleotidyltransferase [Campylobacterota bacterium]